MNTGKWSAPDAPPLGPGLRQSSLPPSPLGDRAPKPQAGDRPTTHYLELSPLGARGACGACGAWVLPSDVTCRRGNAYQYTLGPTLANGIWPIETL